MPSESLQVQGRSRDTNTTFEQDNAGLTYTVVAGVGQGQTKYQLPGTMKGFGALLGLSANLRLLSATVTVVPH